MKKEYRIKLINTETKETKLAWTFTSRRKADDFVANWKKLGKFYDAEVVVM